MMNGEICGTYCDVVVLGGLPVTVEYVVDQPQPDVGFINTYIDDWKIIAINGRVIKPSESVEWLYRRIRDAGEVLRVEELCLENYMWSK